MEDEVSIFDVETKLIRMISDSLDVISGNLNRDDLQNVIILIHSLKDIRNAYYSVLANHGNHGKPVYQPFMPQPYNQFKEKV